MEDFKFPESFENVFASSYGTKRLSKSEIRSGLQGITKLYIKTLPQKFYTLFFLSFFFSDIMLCFQ